MSRRSHHTIIKDLNDSQKESVSEEKRETLARLEEAEGRMFPLGAHRFLVRLPIGMIAAAFLFDCTALVTGDPLFALISFYVLGLGLIFSVFAIGFGIRDWLASNDDTSVKTIGVAHGFLALTGVACIAYSYFARYFNPAEPSVTALALFLLGVVILSWAALKGHSMVRNYAVSIDPLAWTRSAKERDKSKSPREVDQELDEVTRKHAEESADSVAHMQ